MGLKWRYVLGFLPLLLLVVGVVNLLMLHSMSSVLEIGNEPWRAARPRRHRHRQGLHGQEGVHSGALSGGGARQSVGGIERGGELLPPFREGQAAARPSSRAVIFPAAPGDRTTSALVLVLRERRVQPDFCRKDLARCIGKDAGSLTDLVWLKREGNAGQIPERSLAGAAAVNSLGLGWKVWSRRSLCIALHLSRKALKQGARASLLTSWYPECYTLPLQPAEAARLRGDPVPDGGMWVLHGSSAASSAVFPSGVEAAKATGAGVMQRYISPPLTLQGYKFSLLLYVAVTSVSPLRAWLYNDGHVLLALHPYRESVEGRDWRSAHSTRLDAHPDHVQHILGKNGLLRYLAASQLDAHQVWSSIEDAVGLAILSVATYVVPSAKGAGGEQDAPHAGKAQGSKAPRRFKLLAAHVVLDVNLTPWVIKLDPSPSLPLTATGAVKASARAAQPAEGDQDSDGAQGAAQVVGHGPGQQGPAGIGGEHNDDSEYTSWLFEGDVHDMTKELTKELEELKAQQFRVSHMRRRQQRRHDAAVPSPRSLRALLASAGPDASFRRRAAGAPLSPSSVLRVVYALPCPLRVCGLHALCICCLCVCPAFCVC